jgi:hypothetical protein
MAICNILFFVGQIELLDISFPGFSFKIFAHNRFDLLVAHIILKDVDDEIRLDQNLIIQAVDPGVCMVMRDQKAHRSMISRGKPMRPALPALSAGLQSPDNFRRRSGISPH